MSKMQMRRFICMKSRGEKLHSQLCKYKGLFKYSLVKSIHNIWS